MTVRMKLVFELKQQLTRVPYLGVPPLEHTHKNQVV